MRIVQKKRSQTKAETAVGGRTDIVAVAIEVIAGIGDPTAGVATVIAGDALTALIVPKVINVKHFINKNVRALA